MSSGYYKISIRDDTADYTIASNYYATLSHRNSFDYGVPAQVAICNHSYHVYIYSYLYVGNKWYTFASGSGVANSLNVPGCL